MGCSVKILNIGIIGLQMGYSHLVACEQMPGVAVTAACDTDPARLDAVVGEKRVAVFAADYRALVARDDLDIIIVATPDHLHEEHTVAALRAGKHVLCEKPMAPSLEACRRMLEAAQAAGRTLMIGHVARFTPVFRTLKAMADRGELGDLYYVAAEYLHDYSEIGGVGDWRFDPQVGRHVFLGGGCHAVDLMRWFLDDLDTVSAQANHFAVPHLPRDDTLAACYKTVSGRIGRALVAGGARRPYGIHLQLYGTEGTALASNVEAEARVWLKRIEGLGDRWITLPTAVASHPVADQMRHFIACICSGREPLVSGLEGARTVAAALAGIRAAESGQPQPAGFTG